MGIVFVLIFYSIALSVLAAISSVILGFAVKRYLRGSGAPKGYITKFAFALPFLCLAYAGVWFILYAAANTLVFRHDPGLGDGWYTSVGNGYEIDMIDVTDQGIIHPTSGDGDGLNGPYSISGVRRLQVSLPYLFGTKDNRAFEHLGQESQEEDVFFAVDSRDRKQISFADEAQLRAYASTRGTTLNLQPIATVYERYRFGWFDYSAFGALLLVPLAALYLLLSTAFRLKHRFVPIPAIEARNPDPPSRTR